MYSHKDDEMWKFTTTIPSLIYAGFWSEFSTGNEKTHKIFCTIFCIPIGLLNSARPLCIYYIKTSPTSRETEGGGRDEKSRDG